MHYGTHTVYQPRRQLVWCSTERRKPKTRQGMYPRRWNDPPANPHTELTLRNQDDEKFHYIRRTPSQRTRVHKTKDRQDLPKLTVYECTRCGMSYTTEDTCDCIWLD